MNRITATVGEDAPVTITLPTSLARALLNIEIATQAEPVSVENVPQPYPIRTFAYVQATRKLRGPESIRFRHIFIDARNEAEAYAKGGRWSDAHFDYIPDVETINDYVFEVGV